MKPNYFYRTSLVFMIVFLAICSMPFILLIELKNVFMSLFVKMPKNYYVFILTGLRHSLIFANDNVRKKLQMFDIYGHLVSKSEIINQNIFDLLLNKSNEEILIYRHQNIDNIVNKKETELNLRNPFFYILNENHFIESATEAANMLTPIWFKQQYEHIVYISSLLYIALHHKNIQKRVEYMAIFQKMKEKASLMVKENNMLLMFNSCYHNKED